jgi:hypothetical protein
LVGIKPTIEVPRFEKACDGKHSHMWRIEVAGSWARIYQEGPPFEDSLNSLSLNLKQGVWSCFLISQRTEPYFEDGFIMVVEWNSEDTARRIDGFFLRSVPDIKGEFAPF